jgi:hypothetical protein
VHSRQTWKLFVGGKEAVEIRGECLARRGIRVKLELTAATLDPLALSPNDLEQPHLRNVIG